MKSKVLYIYVLLVPGVPISFDFALWLAIFEIFATSDFLLGQNFKLFSVIIYFLQILNFKIPRIHSVWTLTWEHLQKFGCKKNHKRRRSSIFPTYLPFFYFAICHSVKFQYMFYISNLKIPRSNFCVDGHKRRHKQFGYKNPKSRSNNVLKIIFSDKSQCHQITPNDLEHHEVKCTPYNYVPHVPPVPPFQISLCCDIWLAIFNTFAISYFLICHSIIF